MRFFVKITKFLPFNLIFDNQKETKKMQKDISRIIDNVKVLNELCSNLQSLMNEAKTQPEEVINDVFYNTNPNDLIETMHLDEIQAITENLILRIKNLSFNI